MTRTRLTYLLALCALLSVGLVVGCGSSDDDGSTAGSTSGGGADTAAASEDGGGGAKVGLVLAGPPNDDGYYEQVATGLEAAAEASGDELKVASNVGYEPSDLINATKNLALQGMDLIIVDGSSGNAAVAVAKQYPDIEFVIHTAPPPEQLPNVHAYIPQQGITSYVAGALAAKLSKAKKLALVGGLDDVPTGEAYAGWSAGAKSVDPSVGDQKSFVGSYSDPAKAKQATAAMIANGADMIYAYVDAGFTGAAKAVEESGKDVGIFSASVSRCDIGKEVVGSAIIDNEQIMADILKAFADGALPAETKFYGVEDPKMQRVELCPGWDTPENQKFVDETTKALVDGEIDLPKAVTGG